MKIKIAVAVDFEGNYTAAGWGKEGEEVEDYQERMEIAVDGVGDGERRYWVEAEVEKPEVSTIQGIVHPA